MDKTFVVINRERNDQIGVTCFNRKEDAVAFAMESLYGEDWEIMLNDEEWEHSADMQNEMDNLWYGRWVYGGEGNDWLVKESEVL